MDHEAINPRTELIAQEVIDCGLRVHRTLGPGLLESAYETCLAFEIKRCGLGIQRQLALPIIYEGTTLDAGYRIDLLIENAVLVEVKSVEALQPIHLKLSGHKLGFLMNFNVALFKQGIKRLVL